MSDLYSEWLDVPPGERPPNHYQLLGLPPLTHDPSLIVEASDRHLKRLRSAYEDRHLSELLKLIREVEIARETLLDPNRRRDYDATQLDGDHWWESAAPDAPPPPPVLPPTPPPPAISPPTPAITASDSEWWADAVPDEPQPMRVPASPPPAPPAALPTPSPAPEKPRPIVPEPPAEPPSPIVQVTESPSRPPVMAIVLGGFVLGLALVVGALVFRAGKSAPEPTTPIAGGPTPIAPTDRPTPPRDPRNDPSRPSTPTRRPDPAPRPPTKPKTDPTPRSVTPPTRREGGHVYLTHQAPAVAVAFTPTGTMLALAGEQGFYQWEQGNADPLRHIRINGPRVAVAGLPGGRLLVTTEGDVRLFDPRSDTPLTTYSNPRGNILAMQPAPSGDGFFLASSDGTGQFWSLADSSGPTMTFDVDEVKAVRCLAVTPDGKRLVLGCDDGSISVWDVATGQQRSRQMAHAGGISSLAISPEGKLASTGIDRLVRVWAGDPLAPIGEPIKVDRVLLDMIFVGEEQLLTASADAPVRLWDLASGRAIRNYPVEMGANAIAMFGSGPKAQVLIAGRDGSIRLYGLEDEP